MPFITKTVYSDPAVDYHNYAVDLRGRLINDVAKMERNIDTYICDHFCSTKEKRNEIMEVIIANKHLTFQSKAEIAQCILKKTGDTTIKEANKIYDALIGKIAKYRNMIAHFTLDTSITSLNKFKTDPTTIFLIKYANTKTLEPFGKKEYLELSKLISAVNAVFGQFRYNRLKKEGVFK